MHTMLRQFGQGYGADQTSITVKSGTVVIFDGNVPTIDEPVPPLPASQPVGSMLFEWDPAETTELAAGPMALAVQMTYTAEPLEITVNSGIFLLTYTQMRSPAEATLQEAPWTTVIYNRTVNGIEQFDPMIDVYVNGVQYIKTNPEQERGQWYYTLYPGQVWQGTIIFPNANVPWPPP